MPSRGKRLRLGIGDDAAVVGVTRGRELILTTDLSIERVHFLPHLHPPRSVGYRALARSLSDIAAMGGTPRFALVSLAIGKKTTRVWIEEFYTGLMALARRFGVAIIGGDTAVVSGATLIDVVATGEVAPGKALRRSGARPGDQIFVSGRLGISALGLLLLKSGAGQRNSGIERPIRSHLYPEPQCALGRFLSEGRLASALIDISDGLSTDLARLCEASGVGARVWANLIPGPAGRKAEGLVGARLSALALHGGEDYQLLFTVAARNVSRIPTHFRRLPLRRIGEILGSRELLLVGLDGNVSPLRSGGYDHFRKWQRHI